MLATARERRLEIVARGAMIGAFLIAVALWLTSYLGAGLSLQRSALVPFEVYAACDPARPAAAASAE